MEGYKQNFPYIRATLSLVLLLVGGLLLTAFFCGALNPVFVNLGLSEAAVLRITVALQNVFTFAMPAVVTAVIFGENKYDFLSLNVVPSLKNVGLALALFFVSMPAINYTIELNEAVVLPESLAGLEQMLKESEAVAKELTDKLLGDRSPLGLAGTILVVGILTGIGEEFFFRGAVTGILAKVIKNKHIVIWLAAFLFSAFHLQFYGLVPRMLLGALFGYTLLWSRCLWIPVLLHALNNSIATLSPGGSEQTLEEAFGVGPVTAAVIAAVSLLATVALMRYMSRRNR